MSDCEDTYQTLCINSYGQQFILSIQLTIFFYKTIDPTLDQNALQKPGTRILTIQTKFLFNNKTRNDLKLEFLSHNNNNSITPFSQHFLNDPDFVKSGEFTALSEVINSKLSSKKMIDQTEEEKEATIEDKDLKRNYSLIDEKINDLFFCKIKEIMEQGRI